MRLVTKIQDYYDGVVRNSVSDKTYTFVRATSELALADNHSMRMPSASQKLKKTDYTMQGGYVGFCGVVYPYVTVSSYECGAMTQAPPTIHYTYESLYGAYSNLITAERKSRYTYWSWNPTGFTSMSEVGLKKWFDDDAPKQLQEIFEAEKVAYFEYHADTAQNASRVVLYPQLKDYSFYKVFDAVTTFQKIEMYLTNNLVRPDEINIVITNDDKIHTHGFDKFSFRSEKGDKKRKKKRKMAK